MSNYLEKIKEVTGISQQASRVQNVLGASTPSFIQDLKTQASNDIKDGYGTLIGAGAGLYVGSNHKHPWLGLIGGASLGRNFTSIIKDSDRRSALCNMAVTGAAIAAALLVPKHPKAAFALAFVGTEAVLHFGGYRK